MDWWSGFVDVGGSECSKKVCSVFNTCFGNVVRGVDFRRGWRGVVGLATCRALFEALRLSLLFLSRT